MITRIKTQRKGLCGLEKEGHQYVSPEVRKTLMYVAFSE